MLNSLGLAGDGDEVDAIDRVERAFGIRFEHADCENFGTVGDVWSSLIKELRLTEIDAAVHWPSFVRILGDDTLWEPHFEEVTLETRLIGPGLPLRAWWRSRRRRG